MTSRLSLSEDIRNARLTALLDGIGGWPTLQIWQGDMPLLASIPTRNTVLLGSLKIAPPWYTPPVHGVSNMIGAPWRIGAKAEGTLEFFRFCSGESCKMQGLITMDKGRGPMIVDRITTKRGHTIEVVEFTLSEGNL